MLFPLQGHSHPLLLTLSDFSPLPASPDFLSHLPLQVTPNCKSRLQTFSLPITSGPSPTDVTTLSEASAPLPQPPPQPVLSLNSLLRPSEESEHTHASYLYSEHLTFPLPWLCSIQHCPAVSFLRRASRRTRSCLLLTPSSFSTPGTRQLWI